MIHMKMKGILPVFVSGLLLVSGCNGASTKQKESAEATTQKADSISNTQLLGDLEQYISSIEDDFENISDERKAELKKLAAYVNAKSAAEQASNFIFICTHNSRRSHMSQLWAQVAAYHYGVDDVHCYSGGTEATAFNPRSVRALRKAGFHIEQTDSSSNPVYMVSYAKNAEALKGFSKKYDDAYNPHENFAAIMTCSHADAACPLVLGADDRIAIPYEDPKVADNTPEEAAKYDERCRQIATEMFYVFSEV